MGRSLHLLLPLLLGWGGVAIPSARAELQFDVFVGYDGVVREAAWFPIACEIYNDGPGFNGVVELTSGQYGGGQSRRVTLELPTNTRKRFVIPVFSAQGQYAAWDVRLFDERGKVRAERLQVRPKIDVASRSPMFGALARTFAGLPTLPEAKSRQMSVQPMVARLQLELFPDNPIALEGLDTLYLNSEKAVELKGPQVAALLAWVHAGGHLILGVEQPTDVNAVAWLRDLLPCQLAGLEQVKPGEALEAWLRGSAKAADAGAPRGRYPVPGGGGSGALSSRVPANSRAPGASGAGQPRPGMNPPMAQRYFGRYAGGPGTGAAMPDPLAELTDDAVFDQSALGIAGAEDRGGRIVVEAGAKPLVIEADRGRGMVSVLTFSPEREPFRSWKNRSWFWVKLARMPAALFGGGDFRYWGGASLDGVFGEMIDSRQVRKLPVTWLLLLLLVYLVVIGPLDQYWLKRIGRQMLTWLTFPAYVVLFSALIYFIGFMLRAGETEWNELHVVDVLPRGDRTELHGFTYASIYSPANARFPLASDQPFATLRGEFQGFRRGESSRSAVEHRGNGYQAEIFVPVWTSQLYVSDWWQAAPTPLSARVVDPGDRLQVSVANRLDEPLTKVHLAVGDRIYD
ncbi:MAG: hypothetical protein KGS61_21065, partial [Verrucomicrobia bacterium]|nr:hypothetical protein [Verrucomicrobiota bacterium]